jgi:branched-chain amino acid transport system substrate-binding protein
MKIIVIGLLFFAFTVGMSLPTWAQKKPYKIGCNLQLTGAFGGTIAYIKNGLIVGQEQINGQGGIDGHPVELIFEDNATNITRAANIHLKFAKDKEIKAIIGPLWSVMSPTLFPISERENIPHFSLTAPSFAERQMSHHWIFFIPAGATPATERTLDLAMGRGYKKIFAFHDRDPGFMDMARIMKEIGPKHGVEVFITKETFQATDTDMTPQILRFKDQLKDYDALWLITTPVGGIPVLRNLRDQGIRMPVLASHGFGFPVTLAVGKEVVEGVEFPTGKAAIPDQLDESDPDRPVILAFDRLMRAKFNMPVDRLSALGYDSIGILHDAFKRTVENPTRAQLRDAIEKTKDYRGVTGTYNYGPQDHEGLTKKSLIFVKVQNNKFVRIRFHQFE